MKIIWTDDPQILIGVFALVMLTIVLLAFWIPVVWAKIKNRCACRQFDRAMAALRAREIARVEIARNGNVERRKKAAAFRETPEYATALGVLRDDLSGADAREDYNTPEVTAANMAERARHDQRHSGEIPCPPSAETMDRFCRDHKISGNATRLPPTPSVQTLRGAGPETCICICCGQVFPNDTALQNHLSTTE